MTATKQAQQIKTTSKTAGEAMEAAAASAIAKDQNWTLGMTKFTFDDNSVLAVRDVELFAIDADSADSIRAYGSWVGTEDAAEVAEVERLLEAVEA